MATNRFPPGWNEEKVEQVLQHYQDQSESEAVAEDEAAFEDRSDTVMKVPVGLISAVRELIGKHQSQEPSS